MSGSHLLKKMNEFGRRHPFTMFGFMLLSIIALMAMYASFIMLLSGTSFYAALPTVDVLVVAMAASAIYVRNLSIPIAVIATTVIDVMMWLWPMVSHLGSWLINFFKQPNTSPQPETAVLPLESSRFDTATILQTMPPVKAKQRPIHEHQQHIAAGVDDRPPETVVVPEVELALVSETEMSQANSACLARQ